MFRSTTSSPRSSEHAWHGGICAFTKACGEKFITTKNISEEERKRQNHLKDHLRELFECIDLFINSFTKSSLKTTCLGHGHVFKDQRPMFTSDSDVLSGSTRAMHHGLLQSKGSGNLVRRSGMSAA
uniref:Uncharacterized protein n=1 Tax=Magallana gigas TaxID=29159 RepID=K1PSZ7_MAGGI